MRLFVCGFCSNIVYFDNTKCESCRKQLGYLHSSNTMHSLEASEDRWLSLGELNEFRFCANAEMGACNWLIPSDSPERFCAACRHNRTIPDLSIEVNLARWRKFELAKHHSYPLIIGEIRPCVQPQCPQSVIPISTNRTVDDRTIGRYER